MEGGRQAEIAKAILGSMNVPYIVAAPLLIQVLPHASLYSESLYRKHGTPKKLADSMCMSHCGYFCPFS